MRLMRIQAGLVRGLLACALAIGWGGVASAESGRVSWPRAAARVEPKEFGTQDDTITLVSAVSFSNVGDANLSPSFGVFCANFFYCPYNYSEYYATLTVPAGAVIDYIGVNNATTTDAVMGAAIWERDRNGATFLLYGFSFPPHNWATDIAGPLGIQLANHTDHELIIQVEQAPSSDIQLFAWVEIHWRRTVTPQPDIPSFTDVPTSDFGYQYIEALKASGITGGCGDGTTFCPDATLTRRQMAIFLAKALGLHWPN